MRGKLKVVAFCAIVALTVSVFGDRTFWYGVVGVLPLTLQQLVLFQ